MMNTILALLNPVVGIVLTALTAFLTKYLTNEAKKASTWLGNASAPIKQVVALTVSTLIAIITGLTGVHLTGNSLSTLSGGDFQVLLQALAGWVGSIALFNSTAAKIITDLGSTVQGLTAIAAPPAVTVNIHTATPPAVSADAPITVNTVDPANAAPLVASAMRAAPSSQMSTASARLSAAIQGK